MSYMQQEDIEGIDTEYASILSKYPNAVAHIEVSIPYKSIQRIDDGELDMADSLDNGIEEEINKLSGKVSSQKKKKKGNGMVDTIWKMTALGKIDMSYACVGYSLDGRPILDYNLFVDLLIRYGFAYDDVLEFIDSFAESAKNSSNSPILMTNAAATKILTEIEPMEELMPKKPMKNIKRKK